MSLPSSAVFAHNKPDLRLAWCGPSLLALGNDGTCRGRSVSGFFFREARFLSRFGLEIEGEAPVCCSVASVEPHALEFTYVYPPVEKAGGGGSGSGMSGRKHGLLFRTLDFVLRLTAHPAHVEARLTVSNRWNDRARFSLAWVLDADYADLLEAGPHAVREQEAPVEAVPIAGGVHFRYTHPELPFETRVTTEGDGDWRWDGERLTAAFDLAQGEAAEVTLRVRAVDFEGALSEEDERRREERLREWAERVVTLRAPGDAPFVDLTNQSVRLLGASALLDGAEDEWLAPAAGFPLYPAFFGRDALTATWQGLFLDGGLLEATLVRLQRLQGTAVVPERDEEPGRTVQQVRLGPLARLGRTPLGRYYGDQASPLMFVVALAQLYGWTGRDDLIEKHWDAVRRILDWARTHGDADGDGYIEYETKAEQGPKHQGWKDSDNAVVWPDGRQVEPPVVASEVQGYWFAALQLMAALCLLRGERAEARAYWDEAKALKERFNRDFWDDEEGFVAGWLRPGEGLVKTVTSNAGHCLACGIVDDEKVPRLVERLFQPDLFSGWGIRTLSTENPAYNPLSYHLGSVWAVENATIALGLRRYGFDAETLRLAGAVYDLARLWEGGRIPECVGGYARSEAAHPGAYPRANPVQAWNLSAFPLLVQAMLGMMPLAPKHVLALDPILPAWLPEVEVRGLRVGEATLSLRVTRKGDDGRADYEVTEQEGKLHVLRQPPVDDLGVGFWGRLGVLVKDLLPF
ncbi:MAG TPA: glycogen debranching N-terminal domain-containing protein [Rubricoccaceae bacterium]|nr:glycogen debranching N-terminal domain-containing protein [Rubricoccaceae bacterium]